MAKGVKCVKYIGVADVRRISDDDWEKAGVKMQGTVQWDASNGFTVLGERLRDATIEHIREKEGTDFVVVMDDDAE